jgi:1-acyl-sn-glycerol-3-phosphate acyltransferase
MAVRLRVRVIPIFFGGLYEVFSTYDSWPTPGPVRVSFGEPMEFAPHTDYADAAGRIEGAVRKLCKEREMTPRAIVTPAGNRNGSHE